MAQKLIRCDRCKRRLRGEGAGWNVTVEQGMVVGHTCPGCQTAEENAEAEINEATLDYVGHVPGIGFLARPKV